MTYVGQSGPSFTVFWTRTIFDLTFFIIITALGLNIVIAILVNRFSELRCEWVGLLSNVNILLYFIQDRFQKDEKEYCFICGIQNDYFEQAKVTADILYL